MIGNRKSKSKENNLLNDSNLYLIFSTLPSSLMGQRKISTSPIRPQGSSMTKSEQCQESLARSSLDDNKVVCGSCLDYSEVVHGRQRGMDDSIVHTTDGRTCNTSGKSNMLGQLISSSGFQPLRKLSPNSLASVNLGEVIEEITAPISLYKGPV